jgi:ATP-dependent DNA helicase PIF1
MTGSGQLFFIDGPAGTGKTFLYNTLIARLAVEGKRVRASASSGIAALLIRNARTAHSTFNIPINLDSTSTCNFELQSARADRVRATDIAIIDEISMLHRHGPEAIDRTWRQVMRNDKPFGGKVVVFGGDFRQVSSTTEYGILLINCY